MKIPVIAIQGVFTINHTKFLNFTEYCTYMNEYFRDYY